VSIVQRGLIRPRLGSLTTPRGLFLTAAVLLSSVPAISAIRDPDFWWHLRAGRLIIERRALLGTDPFTFTATTHHWTMHEWLSEVMFALLHSIGGLALIVAILCVATWLGLLCIFLRSRLRRPGYLPLGAGVILASIAGYPIWGPRAQMITFALSCLLLLMVDRHLARGGRAVWWLVPIFLVWSNLHSGFIIGLGFLGLMIAGELIGHRLRAPGTAQPRRVRALLWVLAASAAVTMINPNGPLILLYPFSTQGSAAQQSIIQEWHSPNFHQWEVMGFEFMVVSLIAMVVLNRRMTARDIGLATVTGLLAFQSVRHIALFVAAATPAWIEQADMTLQRFGRRRAVRGASTGGGAPMVMRLTTFGLMMVAVLAAIGVRLAGALTTREDSRAYAAEYPVCAARWLAGAPIGLRIFNQYGEGGYLANRLSARGDRVFIFGDAALMGDPLLVDYGDVESLKPRWDRVIRDSGADLILFDVGTPLTSVLEASERWTMVYRDDLNEAFISSDRRTSLRLPPAPVRGPGDVCASARVGSVR